MKKAAGLFAVILIFSSIILSGCSAFKTSTESKDTIMLNQSWPEETVYIGMEVFDKTDEQFLKLQEYFEYLTKFFNIKFIYSDTISTAEQETDFINECVSKKCKAYIGYYNVTGAESMKKVMDNKIYYWGSEQFYDQFASNPYYLGCYTFIEDGKSDNGDYQGGYQMGYNLAKKNLKHLFYCAGGALYGIPMFIDRQKGFEDGVAQAVREGSPTKYDSSADVIYGWPGTPEFFQAVNQKLTEDYDGAAVSFNAAAIFQSIYDAHKQNKIKVATIGEVDDLFYDSIQNGMLSTVVYDCEEVVFANVMVQILNAVTEHSEATRDKSGKAGKIFAHRWVITDSDTYNKVFDYHDDGKFFITAEDMTTCLASFNPDVDFAKVKDFYASYTLEKALESVK